MKVPSRPNTRVEPVRGRVYSHEYILLGRYAVAAISRMDVLTARQRDVISLVRQGMSNGEIATELGISEDGVKAHLSRLYLRFGVSNRVAMLAAVEPGESRRPPSLADLRSLSARAHDRSDRLSGPTAPASLAERLATARSALEAVDVALDLVRDLPPETSGPVLDALRKRVASAVAALDEVNHAQGFTGSART